MPDDIEVSNAVFTEVHSAPEERIDVEPLDQVLCPAVWRTPGRDLASQISELRGIRLVAEKISEKLHSIVVVLDEDDREVYDAIFAAERDLYRDYAPSQFDLRVMAPPRDWSSENLLRESIAHFEKRA